MTAPVESEAPRQTAFHALGTKIPEGLTPTEALEYAHMANWNVRKLPLDEVTLLDTDGQRKTLSIPQKWAAVRTNPFSGMAEALGTVGRVWQPFPNEDMATLLTDLMDESGGQMDTMGVMDGGRSTFMAMRLPGHMEFISPVDGSKDVTDLYIALFNHHDGNGSLKGVVTPLRINCCNMQRIAVDGAKSSFFLRHTNSARVRMVEIRNALNLTFKYHDTFVEECERLIAREMDVDAVYEAVRDVFKVNEPDITERVKNSRVATSAKVLELYRTSPSVAPFMGTAYGVYNAITEYADHYSRVHRKGNVASLRAERSLSDGWVSSLKAESFRALAA